MKISIVTVCFNSAKDLPRTIESIIAEDYRDIEYIVIDGASSDDTLSVLNRYRDFISKIISEPDGGISDAINKGIGLCSGEIIGLLHAGDMYEPHTLSEVARHFENNRDCDVLHGDISYADAEGNILYEQKPDFRKDIIWKKMPFHHPTCFVRKESYDRFGLFDVSYRVAMDYELMLRYHVKGAKFGYVDRKLAVMCLRGLSDKNWAESIKESRRAAIELGRNPVLAYGTEFGRLLRTSLTTMYSKITGRTLRQSFAFARKQTSFIKRIVSS